MPVVRSASITAASAGRLATRTRSLARSYQRNAGMPSITPCRMPIWLAGVVAGSFGRPLVQPVRARPDPPGQRRHRAGRDRHLQHRERHPVELDEDDPVDLGVGQLRRPPASWTPPAD